MSLLLNLMLANDRLSILLASFVSISDSNMAISWVMTPFSLSVSIISGWPCEISPNTLKPSDKISISFKTRLSTVRAQLTRISPLSPTILAKGTNPTRVDASPWSSISLRRLPRRSYHRGMRNLISARNWNNSSWQAYSLPFLSYHRHIHGRRLLPLDSC